MPLDIRKLVELSSLGGSLIPDTDDAYDLGTDALKWRNLYLDGTLYVDTISYGGQDVLKLDCSNDPLTGQLDAGVHGFTTEGKITVTGGGQTGTFQTGLAEYTVLAYTGNGLDIRAGNGNNASQNVVRVDNSGNFDFYDGNLTTTGDIHIDSDSSTLILGDEATDYIIGWDGSDAVHTIIAGDFAFLGGNVGIGTTGPDELLEVAGASGASIRIDSAGHAYMRIDAGSNAYDSSVYYQVAGDSKWLVGLKSDDDYSIQYLDGTWQDFLHIQTDGNVGIGIAAPSYKLDVNDEIGNSAGDLKIQALAEGDVSLFADFDANTHGQGEAHTKVLKIWNSISEQSSHWLAISVSGSEIGNALIRAEKGMDFRVGYGEDMNFDSTAYANKISFGSQAAEGNPKLTLWGLITAVLDGRAIYHQVSDTTDRYEITRFSADILGMTVNMPFTIDADDDGGSDLVVIDGAVGIGVADPDTQLEVFNAGVQVKLSYDATNYFTFATQSDGDLTFDSNKAGYDLDFGDGNLITTGNVGIGTSPSYLLDLLMSASDTRGLNIDQETNPYTGASGSVGLKFARTINSSAGGGDFVSTNFTTTLLNNRNIENLGEDYGTLTLGTYNLVNDQSDISGTSDPYSVGKQTIALRNTVYNNPNSVTDSSSGDLLWSDTGIANNISTTRPVIADKASGTLTYVGMGIYNNIYRDFTLTAGTISASLFGSRSSVTSVGTDSWVTCYGVYSRVLKGGTNYAVFALATGAGTANWSFYVSDSSAGHNSLGPDDIKTFFGTGHDASIYYDGSDLYIDPQEVGTGDTIFNAGNVGIGVTDPDTKLEILNAGNQLKLSFDGTDNAIFAVDTDGNLTITASGSEIKVADVIRGTTSLWYQEYHLGASQADPGASGAAKVELNAVLSYNLDATTEYLYYAADIHDDWDGATDIEIEVEGYLGGAETANDLIRMSVRCDYGTDHDNANTFKTQTLSVDHDITTNNAQYDSHKIAFTFNWDETDNVLEAGDKLHLRVWLDDITSAPVVTDFNVTFVTVKYKSAKVRIEV